MGVPPNGLFISWKIPLKWLIWGYPFDVFSVLNPTVILSWVMRKFSSRAALGLFRPSFDQAHFVHFRASPKTWILQLRLKPSKQLKFNMDSSRNSKNSRSSPFSSHLFPFVYEVKSSHKVGAPREHSGRHLMHHIGVRIGEGSATPGGLIILLGWLQHNILVGGLEHEWMIFPYGNFILPTDELTLIFFGVGWNHQADYFGEAEIYACNVDTDGH